MQKVCIVGIEEGKGVSCMPEIIEKVYCGACEEDVEFFTKEEMWEFYKGVKIDVIENIAVCKKCGKDIYVSALEKNNLKMIYSRYSELKKMLLLRK